ncbi:MAG: hypothetical protein M5U34_40370 [Chloroflexi bacterium]|nr:hypothetical protein [Chloroflexota bacterium]
MSANPGPSTFTRIPGVIDILTLDQFIYRYTLSGLGAIDNGRHGTAQRITPSISDHAQIGLAEFHIGLIHLYWQQYLGALPYFDDAQRHWQFAHNKYAWRWLNFAQNAPPTTTPTTTKPSPPAPKPAKHSPG